MMERSSTWWRSASGLALASEFAGPRGRRATRRRRERARGDSGGASRRSAWPASAFASRVRSAGRSPCAVRRSASPTRLEAESIGRFSEDVEATVYFCCMESLQNVDKHAGPGATAVVRLWERDGRLYSRGRRRWHRLRRRTAGGGQGLANVSDQIPRAWRERRGRVDAGTGVPLSVPTSPSPTLGPGSELNPSPQTYGSDGSQPLRIAVTYSAASGRRP